MVPHCPRCFHGVFWIVGLKWLFRNNCRWPVHRIVWKFYIFQYWFSCVFFLVLVWYWWEIVNCELHCRMGYFLCQCCLVGGWCFNGRFMFVYSRGHLWDWCFLNYCGRFEHLWYRGFIYDLWWFGVAVSLCLVVLLLCCDCISFWFHLFTLLLYFIVLSWSSLLTVVYYSGLAPKYVSRSWEVCPDIGGPRGSGPGMVFYVTNFLCGIMDPMYGTILFDKLSHIFFLRFQENI